jgi:hypothetical protein
MKSRQSTVPAIAAAKAGFSTATAYRIEVDPRLPSQKKSPRGAVVDPLAGVGQRDRADAGGAPGVARWPSSEICRRDPAIAPGAPDLERRIARWRALNGPTEM